MLEIEDEKSLIEQCRKQSRHAQRIVYEHYFGKMKAICIRYVKNEEDALEMLNTAFLKVFDKIKQFKAEGSLEGWMKRIVINTCIDFIRGNKNYKNKFVLTNEFAFYGAPAEEQAEEDANDLPQLSKEEIFEIVNELPPATRVVFNLYVIDEFTHKEIAGQLKISEGTSKWHLSNARKMLREKINKQQNEAKNKTLDENRERKLR